jgi:hypothetical protein
VRQNATNGTFMHSGSNYSHYDVMWVLSRFRLSALSLTSALSSQIHSVAAGQYECCLRSPTRSSTVHRRPYPSPSLYTCPLLWKGFRTLSQGEERTFLLQYRSGFH